MFVLGPGRTYAQYYRFIKRQKLINKLRRELLSLYDQIRQERARFTRKSAHPVSKRARSQMTGEEQYNSVFNNVRIGGTSVRMRNLIQKFNKLRGEIARIESPNNPSNHYYSMMNRIYNSSSVISPLFTSNNREMPRFPPNKWKLHNGLHTERIPREHVRKLLLGQDPGRVTRLNNATYLQALENTVMRRVMNAQTRFRKKKAQKVGRGLAKELNYLKYLPRPVMNFSKLEPNVVLKPSQIKLAREVARAPRFNSNNALMNYLIQGPYKSAANRAKYKRNKFSNTKKYLNYLLAGAPNNWNAF